MKYTDGECWFVARTRRGQELAIRDRLDVYGIRNFVPVCQMLRIRNGRKIKVMAPLIPSMVFLHTTKETACALANGRGLQVFYIIDRSTNRMMVVPDRQMEDFIRVVTDDPYAVEMTSYTPRVGEKVRIVTGNLAGVEGEVLSVEHDTYIVVSVGSLLSARVRVSSSNLEPLR